MFLEPLEPYRSRIACLIFEFGARGASTKEFVTQITPFFDLLPDTFRFSVEVRNREYLVPLYFDALKEHRAAHVFNAWTKMPSFRGADCDPRGIYRGFHPLCGRCCASGALMKTAVATFAPYDEIQDENPEGRKALRDLIARMKEERRTSYIFVNNRFEGNSPETIRAIDRDDNCRLRLALLPEIVSARLGRERYLVIEAPPGAGKTTRVPPALLPMARGRDPGVGTAEAGGANGGAARHFGVGREARGNGRVSGAVRGCFEWPQTRLRFVTEGVLTRRLISDPHLRGVDIVILDEFHERHLDSDLALALLKRDRSPGRLIVMSATLDAAPIAKFLGNCPVMRSGRESCSI